MFDLFLITKKSKSEKYGVQKYSAPFTPIPLNKIQINQLPSEVT